MARQHFNLTTEEERSKSQILHSIQTGQMTKEEFESLPDEKKKEVNDILFDLSSAGINLFHGASALEFIVIAGLRMLMKYKENKPLTEDDRKIEDFLGDILKMHEIGNDKLSSEEWLFDYISYTKYKTDQILQNREEHIKRKKNVTGKA